MPLSEETLELVIRLEAFQLRQLRLLARLERQPGNETGAFSREETALTAGLELVREILPQLWDTRLRARDLRELRKATDEIDRQFVPILDDLEARLPDRPERRKKREKPSFKGLGRSASFHRAFEGPGGVFAKKGRSAIDGRREEMAWDALELAEDGEITEALDAAERVLRSQPGNLTALQALVTVLTNEGLLLNAEETARRGVEEAAHQLGGDAPDSRDWYGDLETRDYMRLKHELAMILHSQGRLDDAIAILRDLLARNPDDNQAIRYLYPSLLVLNGRTDQALSAFEEIGRQYPDDIPEPSFLLNWSLALLRAGRVEEAVDQARKAALSNLYLIPKVLGRQVVEHPIWHGINTAQPPWAEDYVEGFGDLWTSDKNARTFLRRFCDDEETQKDVARLVSLGKMLQQLEGQKGSKAERQWKGLLDDRRALEESPPSPDTIRRVLRALGK